MSVVTQISLFASSLLLVLVLFVFLIVKTNNETAVEFKQQCELVNGKAVHDGRTWVCLK